MPKDKKKKKKKENAIYKIEYTNLRECVKVISKINLTAYGDRSEFEITNSICNTVLHLIKTSESSWVATGGWIAIIDEYDKGCYFVEFFVDASMVYSCFMKD